MEKYKLNGLGKENKRILVNTFGATGAGGVVGFAIAGPIGASFFAVVGFIAGEYLNNGAGIIPFRMPPQNTPQ